MATLDSQSTVAQWVSENPQTAQIFEELQIDFCCGGSVTLAEACASRQLDTEAILCRLTEVIAKRRQESNENWLDAPLDALCDHIESTHHVYLRSELPRLAALIDKVVEAHAANHPELRELRQVFRELRAELEPHMMKEEQILFPAIRLMQHETSAKPNFAFGSIENPIDAMEQEHDAAGKALARLHALTSGFQPPPDACNTYRLMMESLQTLERDLHQHIHKENYILFPRAQERESSLGVETS